MIRGLYLVELSVADWEESLRWYRDGLGLALVPPTEPGKFALLESGGCRVALKPGVPTPGGVLLAFEVDDLAAELARLAGSGIEVDGPLKESPEGYRRARLRDPDGYAVVLFAWKN